MFLGLRTALYYTSDLARSVAWYSDLLGKGPYFNEPFYAGFEVGGYELGLLPLEGDAKTGLGGTVVYWGVPDAKTAWEYVLSKGGRPHHAPNDVGGGILVATLLDPDGNVFGVIENPHFKLPAA